MIGCDDHQYPHLDCAACAATAAGFKAGEVQVHRDARIRKACQTFLYGGIAVEQLIKILLREVPVPSYPNTTQTGDLSEPRQPDLELRDVRVLRQTVSEQAQEIARLQEELTRQAALTQQRYELIGMWRERAARFHYDHNTFEVERCADDLAATFPKLEG